LHQEFNSGAEGLGMQYCSQVAQILIPLFYNRHCEESYDMSVANLSDNDHFTLDKISHKTIARVSLPPCKFLYPISSSSIGTLEITQAAKSLNFIQKK
jgi:hypothetical protein